VGLHVLHVFGGSCIWNGTYKLSLYIQHTCKLILAFQKPMPWVRGLVYGFLLQNQGFDPRPVNMILGQIFLLVLWFFLVIIIQSILHTHINFSIILIRRTGGRNTGTFQENNAFSK